MKCWHCNTELIWGGDHSMEDLNDGEESEYDFYSNFTCPHCHSYVEVFHYSKGNSSNTLIRQRKNESTELATPLQEGEEATP